MDNDGNYPDFKEYPLQSSFHQLIPARAQRGLSTFDVEFTCLDADESYLAIGSNVGIAYLVNREKDDLHKLKDNEHKIPVSSIKVLVSLECLVAVGFRNGAVVVYKVPFQENQELEKFTVEGLHSSAITALEWSKNGMKFFSGDENGIVVCTEIDHLEHQSRSRLLMNEKSKIVQLSYSHFNLVVSTVFRSLIYSLKSNTFCQIGQKERKCFGPFGVIIFEEQNAVHEQNSTVYASRPGQRLWKSDMSGVIQETLIFKNALSEPCPLIETLTKSNQNVSFNDFQFERLARFESYITIWSDSYVVLIDPDKKLVVAASPKLDPIIDVATCKNEIFILRGLRHILRISSVPDIYNGAKAIAEEPSLIEDILEPLKGLSTFVKERSDSLSVQTESNTNIFDWLKKKRSASSPAEFPNDISEPDGLKKDDSLPEIVNLDSNEYIPVKIDASPASMNDIPEFITKDFTTNNDTDDLVYKVKKKNKKTKKVQFVIDAAPSRERFISSISTKENVEEELPNNEVNLNVVPNNVPNALEMNSVLSDSSNLESTNSCDIDMQLKNGQNINEIVDNINKTSDINYVDSDKLLENVLIAYSHSKHKDLPSKDSNNANTSDFMDVSDLNQNVNFESDKEVSNAFSEDIHHDNSNTDVNESAMDIVNNDSDTKQNFDSDDIFSPVSNDGSERKEMLKSESSMDSLSLDDSSISSTSSKNNDPPKYGVDWVQYKAPEILLDISVSCDHIFCVDVRNKAHFSPHPQMGSLNWIELDQPAEKIASSNLETVVWTLYRGTVFAAVHKALCLWENTEWLSIARDVVSIAVDDECGWYAKSNGELITQQNLTLTKPCNYPENVSCNSPALQVAIKDGVLWVLTISGSLLARKSTDGKKSKSVWKEIILNDIPGIDSIYLGYKKTGWIIDSSGFIHFIINVTPEIPEGTGQPWIVEASNYLFRPATRASASLEQVVRRTLNSETLTNLIRGKQHLRLSASSMGVWFCKTYDNLLYCNQNNIIGHNWEMVIPPNTAVATKWSLLAADEMNNSEGSLWCVDSTDELFCYDIKSQTLLLVESPSASRIRCLQPKYQTLWLLSEDGSIYIRRGITPSCLQGIWWQALDLVQFGAQQISHISCSSFVSWACTSNGEVFMRLGSVSPTSSNLNQAWVAVNVDYEQINTPLDKVYVGPQGYPVWAIDKRRNVYAREGVSTSLPIGEKWTVIPDLHAKKLCISNNAVWLLRSSGKIYRRFGVTEKNPCGDYWKQMPGNLDLISVTEDDDLWGLQDGSIYCHYSFVLYNTLNSAQQKPPQRMISEEDWEDIMADDFEVL